MKIGVPLIISRFYCTSTIMHFWTAIVLDVDCYIFLLLNQFLYTTHNIIVLWAALSSYHWFISWFYSMTLCTCLCVACGLTESVISKIVATTNHGLIQLVQQNESNAINCNCNNYFIIPQITSPIMQPSKNFGNVGKYYKLNKFVSSYN